MITSKFNIYFLVVRVCAPISVYQYQKASGYNSVKDYTQYSFVLFFKSKKGYFQNQKKLFYFTSKAIFVFEKFKFQNFRILNICIIKCRSISTGISNQGFPFRAGQQGQRELSPPLVGVLTFHWEGDKNFLSDTGFHGHELSFVKTHATGRKGLKIKWLLFFKLLMTFLQILMPHLGQQKGEGLKLLCGGNKFGDEGLTFE